MERRCPDDSYEKHAATSVDGDKTVLKLESSIKNIPNFCHVCITQGVFEK